MVKTVQLQALSYQGIATTDSSWEDKLATQSPLLKLSTWGLCIVLLIFCSVYGFSFERGDLNSQAGSRQSAVAAPASQGLSIIRLQTAVAYLLCLCIALPASKSIVQEFRRNLSISALLLWAIMSCAWSQSPLGSLINVTQTTMDIAISFYLFRKYSVNDLLKILVAVGSIAAIASLTLIVAFPKYGLQLRDSLTAYGAWQGIFNQKNNCGLVMTFLLLPAFFVQFIGRWAQAFRAIYVVVIVSIVIMTQSANSWLVCASCLAFIAMINFIVKLRNKDALALAMLLFGSSMAALSTVIYFSDTLLYMLGKDPTMTGRTSLWASVMASIMKRPLVGYGYSGFWQGMIGESANVILQQRWTAVLGYAENGVLELWLELGGIGVFLYAVSYFNAVKDAIYCLRREPSQAVLWYCAVLFYVAVSNIGDGLLLFPASLVCIVPFVVYVGVKKEAQRVKYGVAYAAC